LKFLDTAFLVDVLRDVPAAIEKVQALEAEGPLLTTEVVAYELYHGIQHLGRKRRDDEAARIDKVLARMDVLPFDRPSAIRAAELSGELRRRGQSVGIVDLLIASTALAHGGEALVTRDADDFRRVPGVRVETY
jgi:tRNA(fMet)-specific endonuclease VapC